MHPFRLDLLECHLEGMLGSLVAWWIISFVGMSDMTVIPLLPDFMWPKRSLYCKSIFLADISIILLSCYFMVGLVCTRRGGK